MIESNSSEKKTKDAQVSGKPVVDTEQQEPTTEQIAALAYELWVERGSPHGSHEEDWIRAEVQLRGAVPLKKATTA